MNDKLLHVLMFILVTLFLAGSIREIVLTWRDGMIRKNIAIRWRKDEWYTGDDAWRYGLTRVVESAIAAAICVSVLYAWLT